MRALRWCGPVWVLQVCEHRWPTKRDLAISKAEATADGEGCTVDNCGCSCYVRTLAGKSGHSRPCATCNHKAEAHRTLTDVETAARDAIDSRRRVRCQCAK